MISQKIIDRHASQVLHEMNKGQIPLYIELWDFDFTPSYGNNIKGNNVPITLRKFDNSRDYALAFVLGYTNPVRVNISSSKSAAGSTYEQQIYLIISTRPYTMSNMWAN